jgi:uncharacterized protein (DUF4213/DUF364 family)
MFLGRNLSVNQKQSYANCQAPKVGFTGPTASLIPDAFFKRGVDVMAGVRIINPDVINILKQGGSAYHLLKNCSEKIAFVKKLTALFKISCCIISSK